MKEFFWRDEIQVKYASVALKKSCVKPQGYEVEQDELKLPGAHLQRHVIFSPRRFFWYISSKEKY